MKKLASDLIGFTEYDILMICLGKCGQHRDQIITKLNGIHVDGGGGKTLAQVVNWQEHLTGVRLDYVAGRKGTSFTSLPNEHIIFGFGTKVASGAFLKPMLQCTCR